MEIPVGLKIKHLREKEPIINQKVMADDIGITQPLLSNYERGKIEVSKLHLEKIAIYLSEKFEVNITSEDLLNLSIRDLNKKTNPDKDEEIKQHLPKALFTPEPSIGKAPLKVSFKNSSLNATSYQWDFDDNTARSAEKNPQHDFSKNGTYKVRLTASNEIGADTYLREIKVKESLYPFPFSLGCITKITLGLLIVVFLFLLYLFTQPSKELSAEITGTTYNTKSEEIEISGNMEGAIQGFHLWIFVERFDTSGHSLFWPKTEIKEIDKNIFQQIYTWKAKIYEQPNSSHPYSKDFAISIFAVPERKIDIIDDWYKESLSKNPPSFEPMRNIPFLRNRLDRKSGLEATLKNE